MRYGKLTTSELQEKIINHLSVKRNETLLSAGQGEDCAALKIEDIVLLSSDPITCEMPIENIGSLAVDVCCNDIVANGGEPVAMMLTIILPPNYSSEDVETIVKDAVFAARKINVDIVGGHTEFSDCVVRPIVSATAVGGTKRVIQKNALRPGDKLYVTKYLAMEGTTIFKNELFSSEEKLIVSDFKNNLSVLKEGLLLRNCPEVSTMHDITEGGVLGAVAEVCLGNGLGANIYENMLPVHDVTRRLCLAKGINPYRLISSGSMLFSVCGEFTGMQELNSIGVMVTRIGEVTASKKVMLIGENGQEEISVQPDELYKIKD